MKLRLGIGLANNTGTPNRVPVSITIGGQMLTLNGDAVFLNLLPL